MNMTEITLNVIRVALEKGGQHILIAPDGGVSIWPNECANLTHCKDCKKWVDMMFEGGTIKACEMTEMATKPDDYCSYAEAIDDEN